MLMQYKYILILNELNYTFISVSLFNVNTILLVLISMMHTEINHLRFLSEYF